MLGANELAQFLAGARGGGLAVLEQVVAHFGVFSTLTSSVFQRSSKGLGVLADATKAYQLVALKPGKLSATVGTLGR